MTRLKPNTTISAGIALITLWITVSAATSSAVSAMYSECCAKCHGEQGRGDGPYADTLKDRPRNFTDCKTMAAISDETALKAIKEGGMAVGLGDSMPSWGPSLTDEEIRSLLKYVRQFCVAQNSSPKPTMRPNTID
jgi:mono/diheme cytochrome c family protein